MRYLRIVQQIAFILFCNRSFVACLGVISMVRYELFAKGGDELRAIIPLLKSNSVTKVNLPNKCKTDISAQFLDILKEEMPYIDICTHWSIKYRKLKTVNATYASFAATCESNSDSLLLVSGSRPSKSCDAISCLKHVASMKKEVSVPIGVAFNPYFPGLEARRNEEERLVAKMKTGIVSSVWLQCGSDISALDEGLCFLHGLKESGFRFEIIGSLLIPSRRLIAQMKFRPWNGVFLSQEYLSSLDAANSITQDIVLLYKSKGVEPLIETACSSQADFDRVADILQLTMRASVPCAVQDVSLPCHPGESARLAGPPASHVLPVSSQAGPDPPPGKRRSASAAPLPARRSKASESP
jgi:hypothetical protein